MSRRLRAALAARTPPPVTTPPLPGEAAGPALPGPLILDLVAALVQSGAPPPAALSAVGTALQAAGDARGAGLLLVSGRVSHSSAHPDGTGPLTTVLEEALGLAARSGLPPTALLRRSAAELRRRQAATQLRAIRRLEVLLLIPAGLCLLPAFVLLGIVPVVLDLIVG